MKKVIAIASDHAGYSKKEIIKEHLRKNGYECYDFGCDSNDSCDYPDYIHPLAKSIYNGEYEIGLIFCGSGQGVSMTANKHQKIRAAVCWNTEIAEFAKQHNNANVCAFPSRYITDVESIKIVDMFLNTEFEGGRHERRVNKIQIKNKNF